ncbi:MAG: succinate dehydrogenase, cytochrome b556 subunit [Parvularculaceae bacterium]
MAKAQAGVSRTSSRPRPLSPHLSIYRWPVTMLTSILHRATGVALYSGSAFLLIWLVAAASGPEAYFRIMEIYGSPIGIAVMAAYSWALAYHLLNGVRHLFWDAGAGFEKSQANASSYLVLLGSLALAAGVWALTLTV